MVLIAANWKEHKTNEEAIQFMQELEKRISDINTEVVVAPSFVALKDAKENSNKTKIAAQNMFYSEEGAFTGEVSARMLEGFCDYVILGHSERRRFFNETDESVNKKVHKALEHNIIPIICIGESKEQRDNGQTFEVIERMLNSALEGINESNFVIAYEPVWAISGGDSNTKPATPEDAEEAHAFIREKLKEKNLENVHVIYGGSVKPGNISQLMEKENIDGALVGGASLEVDSFEKIIKY